MQVLSVNVGRARPIGNGKKHPSTGIYKEPVEGPVMVTVEGLAGDAVVAQKHHGGPDQAVYLYTSDDYAWWAQELGRELAPGTFGENLTLQGLRSAELVVGDRLEAGEVLLEVTAGRIPCGTLAARMEDSRFVKRFRAAERPGAYCRVLREGRVQAGDPVILTPYTREPLTILETFRDFYNDNLDETALRRHLAAPVAIRDRRHQEERLAKLVGQPGVKIEGPE